jgi:hypothetical protein
MKNTAVDILGCKDSKEWFDEECRQLLEQKSKAYQAYLVRLNLMKETQYRHTG